MFPWRKELHESMDLIDMGLELMKLSFNFTDWLEFVSIKLMVKKRTIFISFMFNWFNCLVSNNKIWCIVDNVYWIPYNFDRLNLKLRNSRIVSNAWSEFFFLKTKKKIKPCRCLKWHTINIYFPLVQLKF